MCSIFGAIAITHRGQEQKKVNERLAHIYAASHQRGRDGRGFTLVDSNMQPMVHHDIRRLDPKGEQDLYPPRITSGFSRCSIIGNVRAEPTTEFVKDKVLLDQQPYSLSGWSIVHNGTIANDKELRTNKHPTSIDSAAIVEMLEQHEAPGLPRSAVFERAIRSLEGSFAILATHANHPGTVYIACNYRPIWTAKDKDAIYFASNREYFPVDMVPEMIDPYSVGEADVYSGVRVKTLYPSYFTKDSKVVPTALVVCSGGLDSVVSAMFAKVRMGLKPHLIHFCYGSRAEGPEVDAVKQVAAYMDAELTVFPLPIYRKEDSPLLNADAAVAGGEQGAEFAHEWVPARNLVMLSVATAFAEARGIEIIVLGNNLEEAGAYPDNEPEFIDRFNDLLPFAVGANKRMAVVMPVGNMMKHEIVALGAQINAPMHLTWSCYRAGTLHCGSCGPCYMRRKAFEINKMGEVIDYVS